ERRERIADRLGRDERGAMRKEIAGDEESNGLAGCGRCRRDDGDARVDSSRDAGVTLLGRDGLRRGRTFAASHEGEKQSDRAGPTHPIWFRTGRRTGPLSGWISAFSR